MRVLFSLLLLVTSIAKATPCEVEIKDIRSRLTSPSNFPFSNLKMGDYTQNKAGVITTTVVYSVSFATGLAGQVLPLVGYVKLDENCKEIEEFGIPVQ